MNQLASQQALNQYSVLGNIAVLVGRALEDNGFDGHAVLADAGIDWDFASEPDTRVPLAKYHELWHLAVRVSGDPCFGVTAAQSLQPADLHGLGLGMLASETLANGIRRIVRYGKCLSLNTQATFAEQENTYLLRGNPRIRIGDAEPAEWAFGAACFVQLCRITASRHVRPILVTLPREEPPCADRVRAFFDCEVRYGEQFSTVTFDRDELNSRLTTYNPRLARANEQVVIDYLAEFEKNDVVTRSRAAIIEALPSGRPSEAVIAEALNMSPRNFRRRLSERGTTFRGILDSIRQDLSRQYLEEGERSIAEIAFLLGYSEPTNFARWFRQTSGITPMEFRRQESGIGIRE